MRINLLYADDTGESHWSDIPVSLQVREFAPPAQQIEISVPVAATQTMFLRLRAGWDEPSHPTPVAQRLICLAGQVEVTASDGARRRIGPGDIWDMRDTHGAGHHTRVTSTENFECVIVQFSGETAV